MKQIQKTADILNHLRQSVGNDVNLDALSVYEAIALNTRPLRKAHPLYNGSVADRSMLLEMASELSRESRPVQLMHDTGPLPVGRVFHGLVVDKGTESELRVLFFIDPTEADAIAKIDAGSVDQVSVSILPKHIYNSASGFDYLGADAQFEHVWTGTDPDGNTLGKNGVFGKLVGLDKWFEMSLVGMGGAQNARIVSRDQSHFGSSYQKLAASGVDPSAFVLVASTRTDSMDLTTLIAQLTDTKVELATSTASIATLTATNAAQATEITNLKAQLEAAAKPDEALTTQVADLTSQVTAVTTDKDAAIAALQDVAKTLLTAAGKADAEVPKTVAELKTLIDETKTGLAAALVAGGRAQDAVSDVATPAPIALGAFRAPRR